ncbi:MAG: hypothetical protein ABIZ64_15150 [Casimicrobium sp.]
MKNILVIAAFTSAVLGASSAIASQTGGTTLDTQEIRDSSLRNSYATGEVFKSARGNYAMDDGTTLSLYKSGNKFVAEVSGKEPFEVVATKSGNFVAVNGSAQLKFVQDAGGKVARVVLTQG